MSLRYLSRDGLGLTSLLHFFNYYSVNNRKLSGYSHYSSSITKLIERGAHFSTSDRKLADLTGVVLIQHLKVANQQFFRVVGFGRRSYNKN